MTELLGITRITTRFNIVINVLTSRVQQYQYNRWTERNAIESSDKSRTCPAIVVLFDAVGAWIFECNCRSFSLDRIEFGKSTAFPQLPSFFCARDTAPRRPREDVVDVIILVRYLRYSEGTIFLNWGWTTPHKKYRVLYDICDFLQTRMDDPPYELFQIQNRTILIFTVFMVYDIFKTRMDGS